MGERGEGGVLNNMASLMVHEDCDNVHLPLGGDI